ncbi:hypothetical protein CBR_g17950 [Chara braunii]|uniref:Uncharacterized protein n=1 Tax=Chara braunii TaxID=69332 RepID=A0A388KVZ8_CHABU|nr:hypothetical protein CBR_g17950 [Chara braunii]|eukprot:GBG74240.1 hypothetical protein CBR_g17950 [Chara braunii]
MIHGYHRNVMNSNIATGSGETDNDVKTENVKTENVETENRTQGGETSEALKDQKVSPERLSNLGNMDMPTRSVNGSRKRPTGIGKGLISPSGACVLGLSR